MRVWEMLGCVGFSLELLLMVGFSRDGEWLMLGAIEVW